MFDENDIKIEYEPASKSYYICWTPALAIISSGVTKIEVLNSLQEAAHFLINSITDSKLRELLEGN